jgi:hypothetical protein
MESTSDNSNSIPAATSGSRSKLLSTNFKNFLSKPAITHPQKALTVQLWNAEQKSDAAASQQQQSQQRNMCSENGQTTGDIVTSGNSGFPKTSEAPGEQFEPRQTATSEDYEPDPSKSIKLNPQRQALVDDVSFRPAEPRKHANSPHLTHTAHLQY